MCFTASTADIFLWGGGAHWTCLHVIVWDAWEAAELTWKRVSSTFHPPRPTQMGLIQGFSSPNLGPRAQSWSQCQLQSQFARSWQMPRQWGIRGCWQIKPPSVLSLKPSLFALVKEGAAATFVSDIAHLSDLSEITLTQDFVQDWERSKVLLWKQETKALMKVVAALAAASDFAQLSDLRYGRGCQYNTKHFHK